MSKNILIPNLLKASFLALVCLSIVQLFTHSYSAEKSSEEHAQRIKDSYNIFSFSPPSHISFSDDSVPLHEPEVYERLDRELHANTYFHSNTILYFKRANRWFPVIEPILEKNNIPNDFKYLALIESGLQNVVSPAGATGFWQFLESTGKEYGLVINGEIDERYHVEKSTEAACKYLNDAYELYKDWALVAASYNTGMNRITKELERQGAASYYDLLLNNETGRYVFRILAVKQILENPVKYGFNIRKSDLYAPLEFENETIQGPVQSFSDFAKKKNMSYKILKYFNPWLRRDYLKNTNNTAYTIKLPTNSDYKLH